MSATRECGVCWYAYDPAVGDEVWQVPAGTPFEALPPEWRCPRCDGPRERFLPPVAGPERDGRVAALEAAYQHIYQTKMRDLPVLNPKLRVEAVGFRPYEGGLFGALVTPWSINAVFFPPPGSPAPELGRSRALPSGHYTFLPQKLEGVDAIELSSVFSPALEFDDHAAAVATALEVVRLLLLPEPPPPDPTVKTRRALIPFLDPGPAQ